MNGEWKYNEEDRNGEFHSRRRDIHCPQCNTKAKETECFDVDGRWIHCPKCGLIDLT